MKLTSDDVKEQMYKLAKKGLTPSQIGELFGYFVSIIARNKSAVIKGSGKYCWTAV